MRHKISALFLSAFFAMSIVACDDILLPNDPWDPGNGGGGDTTENPVDTNGNHESITLSGYIASFDSTSIEVPAGAKVVVIWHRADDQDVIFGEGEIFADNTWEIKLNSPLPSEAYWGSPSGERVWGVGSIALVDASTPSSGIYTGVPIGVTSGVDVIFDTDKRSTDGWGEMFLGNFPKGYMAGMADPLLNTPMPIYNPTSPDGIMIMRWQ